MKKNVPFLTKCLFFLPFSEDHNLSSLLTESSRTSSRTNNTNRNNSSHEHRPIPLARQPDLAAFFNFDEDEPQQHQTNFGGNVGSDFERQLFNALSNYSEDSDVARQLMDQLTDMMNNRSEGRNSSGNNNNPNNNSTTSSGIPRPVFGLSSDAILSQMMAGEQQITDLESFLQGGGNKKPEGAPQEFLDGLDRVSKKVLKDDDTCPICTARFLDDEYPLVVRLPCNTKHKFDLECIGPWLMVNASCPLCRVEFLKKKEPPIDTTKQEEEEEEEEFDDLYG